MLKQLLIIINNCQTIIATFLTITAMIFVDNLNKKRWQKDSFKKYQNQKICEYYEILAILLAQIESLRNDILNEEGWTTSPKIFEDCFNIYINNIETYHKTKISVEKFLPKSIDVNKITDLINNFNSFIVKINEEIYLGSIKINQDDSDEIALFNNKKVKAKDYINIKKEHIKKSFELIENTDYLNFAINEIIKTYFSL